MSIFSAKPYIFASVAVLVLAASGIATSLKQAPAAATTESSPWFDTNSNAAASRANLKEKVLSPTAVTKIQYLRSVVSPLISPSAPCGSGVVAPVLVGGSLYVITNAELSKYNPGTGALIWRAIPDPSFSLQYDSLAISGNLVIVGAETTGCVDPASLGEVFAFSASTGAPVWQTPLAFGGDSVIAQSFVVSTINAENNDTSVFDLSTGKFLWDTGGGCTQSANLVVAALVMTYGCDAQGNTLEARTLATGAIAWSLPGNWTIQRGDLSGTAGQHLDATNPSGTVVDLNPLTGQTGYSLSGAVNVLAVDAARVYATCGSQGFSICGYSIATGALEWQANVGTTIAAAADNVLYLDSGQALNAATGQLISTVWASPNRSRASAIAIGDGRIAVVSDPRVLDLLGLPGS